jgi:hypothetical protein
MTRARTLLGHARRRQCGQAFFLGGRLSPADWCIRRCRLLSRQRWNLAARRVAEQLRQLHRRDQARLFFIRDDEGTEHELVFDPRHRQTDVHPRTQLRGVDADFPFVAG